jgi:hypothetical protein
MYVHVTDIHIDTFFFQLVVVGLSVWLSTLLLRFRQEKKYYCLAG